MGAILWIVLPHRVADQVAAWIAARPLNPNPNPPTAPAPVATAPAPAPREAHATAPVIEPRPPSPDEVDAESPATPIVLRPGRSLLAAGVRARLAPRGAATVRAGAGRSASVVALQRGTLDIAIDPARAATGGAAGASPAARWQVQVAAYRLEAEPGRFRVAARAGRVNVAVKSGTLTIWSSRRLLATVVAGEHWTNLAANGRLPADAFVAEGNEAGGPAGGRGPAGDTDAAPEPAPAQPPAEADCARLTRQGAIDPALACFAREAAQPGLVGELALIELARIRRDVRGDLAGAEQALAEHRRRFPHGALADEATGSRVELLARLGRAAEALSEAEHLSGSEAIFWRAVCLAKLGRKVEAQQAFDAYLARPEGKRRAEAARMRADLGP